MALALNIAGGAITLVQNGVAQINVGTTAQPALPVASTAGNCLIAIFGNMVGATVTGAPAGWTLLISQDQGGLAHIEVWVRPNNPGGIQTPSFTTSTGGVVWQCQSSEWSNVSVTAALDTSGSTTATSGTTLAPAVSPNVAFSGDLAISAWVQKIAVAGAVTFTTPATFTRLIDDGVNAGADTGLHHFDAEYKINPSTGALGPTLTSNTTTTSAAGVIVCLKQANPAVDQSNFLKYGSMTLKYNTFDFALVDPATVPSLGDSVVLTSPTWSGKVASVSVADIVDRASGHKVVTVVATNQIVITQPTPALAQSGTIGSESGSTTISPKLPFASVAGTCLIAVIGNSLGATVLSGPAGWIKLAAPIGYEVWSYPNNPGGIVSSGNFTFSAAINTFSQHARAHLSEWSNVNSLDVSGTATGTSSITTLAPTTSGNVSLASELAISGWNIIIAQVSTAFTSPGGWTRLADNGGTSGSPGNPIGHLDIEYKINPATGATLGPTLTSSVAGDGRGAIVSLRAWTPAPFALSDAADTTYELQLEDGTGDYQLEDGSGDYALESWIGNYRGLAVRTSQNSDGTTTTAGSCTTYVPGLAAGQTVNLTSANLAYSAQAFYVTNVVTTWQGLQTPLYRVEFGDAPMTMQTTGGGVLIKSTGVASVQSAVQMPAGVLAYASVVANQTGITAVTDLTGLTASVTVSSGRRIRVTAVTNVFSTVAQDLVVLQIMEGATVLQSAVQNTGATTSTQQELNCAVILTPTAGAHTYKLTLTRVGTGNAALFASATYPAYILVEDIGT